LTSTINPKKETATVVVIFYFKKHVCGGSEVWGNSAAPSLSVPTGFMPALGGTPLKTTGNLLPELKII
jgi:hypothetical protein